MTTPQISIAIAAYNGEKYIAQQLKSLLEQTLPPDEIVICDDSANDLTARTVQEFQCCGIIKYVKNPVPLGVAGNFEKAISLCKGQYIFLCDQDDVWLPEKVELMVDVLKNDPAVDGVFCNSYLTNSELVALNKTLWGLRKFTPTMQKTLIAGDALKVFCRRVTLSGHNVAFKRRALEYLLPFPELTPFYPDTYAALAIALNSQWNSINKCLTLYRIHNSNRSNPAGNTLQAVRKARNSSCSAAKRNHLLAEELLQRCSAAPEEKRKLLKKFSRFHKKRSEYANNIFIRALQVVSMLCTAGYHRYANGLQSAAADIVFRQQ